MTFTHKNFELDTVLCKPLMAHLSTIANKEPRESPIWFVWETASFWIFGIKSDSFIHHLMQEPQCAVGIIDFDLNQGVLKHVGIRGIAKMHPVHPDRLNRFVSKYLGNEKNMWNPWFIKNVVNPLDTMAQIIPKTVVAKDVSFFKTGPQLAQGDENGPE